MLAIVKTGSTIAAVRERRGDFERWFTEGVGASAEPVLVVDVAAGEALPEPAGLAGAIVTGSAAMVTARADWSVACGRWMARLVSARVPLLAVCYGHQLLADELGGSVGVNPRGREIGTIVVERAPGSDDDRLLGALPRRLVVQATHVEAVLELPPGAVHLAGNAADPHQAYRVGDSAWAVQFHPEFDADVMRTYLTERAEACRAEGLDPEALLAEARDSDHGRAILRRFGELIG